MPRARINSTTVSLTADELEKLEALYRVAWGSSYNPDKTQRKLAKGIDRIKDQQSAARYRAAQREAR